MAFSSSITGRTVIGDRILLWGTFTNGEADAGGTISTGFGEVNGFSVIPTSHVDAAEVKYSASNGTVTLVTGNGVDGNWFAIGK